MRRPVPRQRRLALAFVSVFAATTAATVLAGDALDGKVQYWNDTPEIVALVERLRAFPRDTPVDADIWENILPQTGMLPPGHWYVHPLLVPFVAPVDSIGERLQRTRNIPGALRVRRNTGQAKGEVIQKWYLIENESTGSR